MKIHRAHKSHLSRINTLLSNSGLLPITIDALNKRDIAVVVIDGPEVVGFIWCGLMAKKTKGYIDHFVVHPDYIGNGVGAMLGTKLLSVAQKLGVKFLFGVIEHHASHDKSVINASKIGMQHYPVPHTIVFREIN
jgi:ribosomal protein S18 acetylase RimI-like enzyme